MRRYCDTQGTTSRRINVHRYMCTAYWWYCNTRTHVPVPYGMRCQALYNRDTVSGEYC